MKKRLFCVFLVAAGLAFGRDTLTLQLDKPGKAIGKSLYGVFFEEINHAGDGGLYAELIRNRSFEDDATAPGYWSLVKSGPASGTIALDKGTPLNSSQVRSLRLDVTAVDGGTIGVANPGYWGINVVKDRTYRLSLFARCASGYNGTLTPMLQSKDGSVTHATGAPITGITTAWKKFTTTLTATGSASDGRFLLFSSAAGTVWLDVVSLFPPTHNNRPNGLRPDLFKALKDLKPGFLRFPGGNFVEGDEIYASYYWKKTIGPIETRPGHRNLQWNYWSQDGLGYHEYLDLGEDLDAQILYVANCGDVRCGADVPLDQLGPYVQDAVDAIEYAIGPVTGTWGAKRAENGHPAPFNLKYVEIGNEANNADYLQRFARFYDAIKARYPGIVVISNKSGSGLAKEVIIDHHMYSMSTSVFNHYNWVDPNGQKIFVGEYSANGRRIDIWGGTKPDKGSFGNAILEALLLMGCEKNSPGVAMSCYAPLFVNDNDWMWAPNLIIFDSHRVCGTPSYHMEKLFGNNKGDVTIPLTKTTNDTAFFCVASKDSATNDIIIKIVHTKATQSRDVQIQLTGSQIAYSNATVWTLSSANLADENTLAAPTKVAPVPANLNVTGNSAAHTLAPRSISVVRIFVPTHASNPEPSGERMENGFSPRIIVTNGMLRIHTKRNEFRTLKLLDISGRTLFASSVGTDGYSAITLPGKTGKGIYILKFQGITRDVARLVSL